MVSRAISSRPTLLDGYLCYKGQDISLQDFLSYLTHECPDDFLPYIQGFQWLYHLQKTHIPESRKLARQLLSLWSKQHIGFWKVNQKNHLWKGDLAASRLNTLCQLENFLTSTAPEVFLKTYTKIKNKHASYLKKSDLNCLRTVTGLLWCDKKLLSRFIHLASQYTPISPYQSFLLLRDMTEHSIHFEEELLPFVQSLTPILRFFRHSNGQLAQFDDETISKWEKSFEPEYIEIEEVDALLSAHQTYAAPLMSTEYFAKAVGFGGSFIIKKSSNMIFEWQNKNILITGKLIFCDSDKPFQFGFHPQLLCEQISYTELEISLGEPFVMQAFSLNASGIESCVCARTNLKVILSLESEYISKDQSIGPFMFYSNGRFHIEDQRILLICEETTSWEIVSVV